VTRPRGVRSEAFHSGRGQGSATLGVPDDRRRICIGQSFALMEMVLMAAIMSQRFTFDVLPDHPVERESTLTLRPKRGVHVIARRREAL
jgi:Cytochrome P450